ncbi:FGGY-family carbohydrate kinase [Niabella terrae]
MDSALFIGIDLGTQGLRVIVLDAAGAIVTSSEQGFPLSAKMREEQDPEDWWRHCLDCLEEIATRLTPAQRQQITAITVDSTSGTVLPVDQAGQPLHAAIMYSDQRSARQAKKCTEVARNHVKKGFTGFSTSTGLAKMVWYMEQFPEAADKIYKWIHAADFITGKLSGQWGVTDYTNALKSGYDLTALRWPEYLSKDLDIQPEWLPEVQPSGVVIGQLLPGLAQRLGLSEKVRITTGITDGCASQVASGAMQPGQWNTTIGTTLVIKGVTREELIDPQERLYSHRHPAGYWMPGGAGNIGADWVSRDFNEDKESLNAAAAALTPTGLVAYPLLQKGERFPFSAPDALGFGPAAVSREQLYTANMEGVACAERYAYEMIETLSEEPVTVIYTAGGASNSESWLQIRSDLMQRPICKMRHTLGAVGAAIVAASGTLFPDITAATKALTQAQKWTYPRAFLRQQYEDQYGAFIEAMRTHQFIQ